MEYLRNPRSLTLASVILAATLVTTSSAAAAPATIQPAVGQASAGGTHEQPSLIARFLSVFAPPTFTRVQIPLIGLGGGSVGCGDEVVFVQRSVQPTQAPLTAALRELLAIDERTYGESGLYNPLYQSDLRIQRVAVRNGIATIELSGDLRLGGVCDNPRVQAQLEHVALQYQTVHDVRVLINGQPLEQALSLVGAPEHPAGTTYVVQPGDNLFRIARRFGTTIPALMEANPAIVHPWRIYVGQRLGIPTEQPVLTVTPAAGAPGAQVRYAGSGFTPGGRVSVLLIRGLGLIVAETTADAQGRVSGTFTLPRPENVAELAYGPVEVFAIDAASGRETAAAFFRLTRP